MEFKGVKKIIFSPEYETEVETFPPEITLYSSDGREITTIKKEKGVEDFDVIIKNVDTVEFGDREAIVKAKGEFTCRVITRTRTEEREVPYWHPEHLQKENMRSKA